jgi:hypothetical protein
MQESFTTRAVTTFYLCAIRLLLILFFLSDLETMLVKWLYEIMEE